ncbi:hypothetical protein QAD02_018249 [Eretmocerus hayati]|uniref:Uncharacterized protein n=1 Tax=Eretmocerus hayati TaxID=131215 RepID=A0ACC2PG64_9HYME|nr:hypothetical protein QAD02_018249 [Eretmocerus hayati]
MSLRDAIRSRNTDLVRRLIACGAEANGYKSNISYHRPLHLAVISRSTEIVQILLEGGADVNILSQDGETPLTLAAKLENNSVVDILLTYNVENTEDAFYNLSHLHVACTRNKVDVCGADFTAREARNMTPLHLAHLHRNEDIIDLILQQHMYEHRNPEHDEQLSHFHIACTRDNPSIVEHFLRSGVDAGLRSKSRVSRGWRPIDFALYYECPKVTELLLKSNVTLSSLKFHEILKCIFIMGNTLMHELITKKGFCSTQMRGTDRDLTTFHHACIQDDSVKIEELLADDEISAPYDFNMPIWTGCTPLHLAVQCNSVAVTTFLLERGADSMIQDKEGNTALHIAFKHGFRDVFDNILEHLNNSVQNLTDEYGLSILHILCTTTKVKAIEILISRGINISARVSNECICWAGFTPLYFAVKFRQQKVLILLLKNGADISIRNLLGMDPINILLDRLEEYFYDGGIENTISEILLTISLSLKKSTEHSGFQMSVLHALCIKNTDAKILQEHLSLCKNEINELTNVPSSPKLHKCTPLHLVMQRHYFQMAKILMANGSDSLIVNHNGETPLESAASEFGLWWDTDACESLFPLDIPIEKFRTSHFHLACSLGLTNVVNHILNGIDDEQMKMRFVNCLNDAGQTPLISMLDVNEKSRAAAKKELTLLLLKNKADVNAKDFELKTPLHLTEHPEDFDVVRTLVSYGANIDAQNVYGRTPLHSLFYSSLLENNNSKIIEFLLENGADINILDERGETCMVQKHQMYQNRRHNDNMIKDSVVTLMKHAKKLEVLGLYVNQVNKKAYSKYLRRFREFFNEATFVDQCNKELESLTSIKIDSWTTLKDILRKSPNQMTHYCDNPVLQTILASNEISERFPMYGFLISLQLKYGNECKKALAILCKTGLPCVCVDVISKYLSKMDLRNIVLSTKESDE